jgi:hypothetical protein
MAVTSPLHAQVLSAINSTRPYLYGDGLRILMLKFNGTNKQYDPLEELDKDFIPSFDRSGNITLMVPTDQFDETMKSATHLVFDNWIYQLTEPAKPKQGPFPMWKATGRPLGTKYVAP